MGFKLIPMAGSDYPYYNPPGVERNYVYVGDDNSIDAYYDALRAQRTFVTNGPMLEFTVNGELPGADQDLYFLDPQTGDVTPFRVNSTDEWHPVFSTDGSQIIFTSDPDPSFDWDLFIIDVATPSAAATRLTPNNSARDDDAEFKKPGG